MYGKAIQIKPTWLEIPVGSNTINVLYLHDGGDLRELQRPLDDGVDSLVPALQERQDRVVQHLCPARSRNPTNTPSQSKKRETKQDGEDPFGTKSEDNPVVDGQVQPPQHRDDARHRQSRNKEEQDAEMECVLATSTGAQLATSSTSGASDFIWDGVK